MEFKTNIAVTYDTNSVSIEDVRKIIQSCLRGERMNKIETHNHVVCVLNHDKGKFAIIPRCKYFSSKLEFSKSIYTSDEGEVISVLLHDMLEFE